MRSMPSLESFSDSKYSDRENCTVFVADLPTGCTDEELTQLFKDVSTIH